MREIRMQKILSHLEKKVGHKLELTRDEGGRWSLPMDLVTKYNIQVDQ